MSSRLVRAGNHAFRHRGLLLPIAIVLLLLPSPQLMRNPAVAGLIGLAIALVGQAIRSGTIGLEYIIRGGRNHQVYADRLVTGGIYSHVRNPMYVGNFFLLIGLSVASNSWVFLLAGIPIAALTHVAIVAAEEDFLRAKFGVEFDAFCARSPRWVPRLSGLGTTFQGATFNWSRVLAKEYQKPVDWLIALAVVTIVNIAREGTLGEHVFVVALMATVIVARIGLYLAARAVRARDDPASAGS
jgi:protein-S-isoprenylcysteine O-methyltransferase Ste14